MIGDKVLSILQLHSSSLSLRKISEISPRLKPFPSPIETLAKPSRVTDWVLALGRRAYQACHLHHFGSSRGPLRGSTINTVIFYETL